MLGHDKGDGCVASRRCVDAISSTTCYVCGGASIGDRVTRPRRRERATQHSSSHKKTKAGCGRISVMWKVLMMICHGFNLISGYL